MLDALTAMQGNRHATAAPSLHLLRSFRNEPASPIAGLEHYTRIFQLDARFGADGVWSGASRLVETAYRSLGIARVQSHLLSLHAVLPAHRGTIRPEHLCLTDTAGDAEKTRFHPLNRAYRLVHDLVGLIFDWKQVFGPNENWAVVVWNFDEAQHLGARFFAELARRAAPQRRLDIIVAHQPGWQDPSLDDFALQDVPASFANILLSARPIAAPPSLADILPLFSCAAAADEHAALERYAARLIAAHDATGDALAAARIALKTFVLYTGLGYYHEARSMLDRFLPYWDGLIGEDEEKCAYHVAKINICLLMTDDPEAALRTIERLGLARLTKPHLLANIHYSLGMHFLRYAKAKDFSRAESHLLRAADLNRQAGAADPFKKVFFDNGLAFLRVRQGRPHEALDLCRNGYAFLTAALGEQRHCLHRSVLQYNMGNLLAMMGDLDAALVHYRNAIAMDPNYSEYYNEIGNIYQDQARYLEAIAAYEQAIARSAPYAEVFANKAICHLRQEEWHEALQCFDTTLELDPNQPEACVLRADLLRELGRLDEALQGYTVALTLGCNSAALRVNRAVLHYTNGNYALALADMDHAIALEPHDASHYENRAAIHAAMARETLAAQDMEHAERCRELV